MSIETKLTEQCHLWAANGSFQSQVLKLSKDELIELRISQAKNDLQSLKTEIAGRERWIEMYVSQNLSNSYTGWHHTSQVDSLYKEQPFIYWQGFKIYIETDC